MGLPSQTRLNLALLMSRHQAVAMVRKLISSYLNIRQLKGARMLNGIVHIWGQICLVKPSVDMSILFLLEMNIRYRVVQCA